MTQTNKSYATATVNKLPGSEIEVVGSIAPEAWGSFRAQALKNLNDSVKLDGFRKGNIPENVLISKIGEMAVLEEMAELAVPKAYIDIVIEQKLDVIGKPAIHVTKLAANNPIEFKAKVAVVPEVTLPDYKAIAAKVNKESDPADIAVTPKDIEDAILRVRKMHASHEGHDHDKMTPEEHDKAIMDNLPELTDDMVKKIGDFEDVPDFKNKLSGILAEDKKNAAREKGRARIADALADKAKVEIPEILIESELNRSQSQFEADIERMGLKLEDYLKHAKKEIADIRKEWRPNAEKKAKLQLILNEIAKAEKIAPTPEEIEAEVSHIVAHYQDADRERAAVYAETVLTNDKVFEFLEGQKA